MRWPDHRSFEANKTSRRSQRSGGETQHMKKLIMPLAVVAAIGMYAGTASAQCFFGFDTGDAATSRGPAPAKGVKGSMVRNYAGCPSTEHPSPDPSFTTESGTQA